MTTDYFGTRPLNPSKKTIGKTSWFVYSPPSSCIKLKQR